MTRLTAPPTDGNRGGGGEGRRLTVTVGRGGDCLCMEREFVCTPRSLIYGISQIWLIIRVYVTNITPPLVASRKRV